MPPDLNSPPCLLTIKEIAAMLKMSIQGTRRLVSEQIVPKGGACRVGTRIMVHAWALNDYLRSKVIKRAGQYPMYGFAAKWAAEKLSKQLIESAKANDAPQETSSAAND